MGRASFRLRKGRFPFIGSFRTRITLFLLPSPGCGVHGARNKIPADKVPVRSGYPAGPPSPH